MTQGLDRYTLFRRDMRHLRRGDSKHHHMLVKNLVVSEIVCERGWSTRRLGTHEHGRSWHAQRPGRFNRGHELLEWDRPLCESLGEQTASGLPCCHQGKEKQRNRERDPSALHQL